MANDGGRSLGWLVAGGGLLVLAFGIAVGMAPISSDGGSCGSSWIRQESPTTSCSYGFSMWVSIVAVVIGVAAIVLGLRVRRGGDTDRSGILRP